MIIQTLTGTAASSIWHADFWVFGFVRAAEEFHDKFEVKKKSTENHIAALFMNIKEENTRKIR